MPQILSILIALLVGGMVLGVLYVVSPFLLFFAGLLAGVSAIGFTMVGLARWLERRLGRTEINRSWREPD